MELCGMKTNEKECSTSVPILSFHVDFHGEMLGICPPKRGCWWLRPYGDGGWWFVPMIDGLLMVY